MLTLPAVSGLKTGGAAIIALAVIPTMLVAETVQLHSYDGSAVITGTLLDYGSASFLLDTPVGELRVAASVVSCEGARCPATAAVVSDLKAGGYLMSGDATSSFAAVPVFCPVTAAQADANS